jgi:hypothetical protein
LLDGSHRVLATVEDEVDACQVFMPRLEQLHDEVRHFLGVCQPSYYRFGERVYWEQMSRYRAEGNPFRWMPDGQKRLVMRFIRSTALEFYRGWVAEGKRVPKDEAAKLVAQLTLDGVRALMR